MAIQANASSCSSMVSMPPSSPIQNWASGSAARALRARLQAPRRVSSSLRG
jgi:hypothetical protein